MTESSDPDGTGTRIAALQAENEQLRQFIAASKDVLASITIEEAIAELDDLRARCTAAMDQLTATGRIEYGGCPFCDETWPHYPEATKEERCAIAAKHDARCSKNPLRIERDALRRAVVRIGDAQIQRRREALEVWAIRDIANDVSAPFDDERVEARLAYLREEHGGLP